MSRHRLGRDVSSLCEILGQGQVERARSTESRWHAKQNQEQGKKKLFKPRGLLPNPSFDDTQLWRPTWRSTPFQLRASPMQGPAVMSVGRSLRGARLRRSERHSLLLPLRRRLEGGVKEGGDGPGM